MTRINLFPWRAHERKERERQVYIVAAGAAIFMLLVVVYIPFHIRGLIEEQSTRNAFLEGEIKVVEGQIKEIQELEQEKAKVLSRMKVIEQLQSQRPQVVHLFDELVRTLPEGVYITSIKQTGAKITVEGVAQSNARVSALMRNIDGSLWVENPHLNVIESITKDNAHTNKFILELSQITSTETVGGEGEANSKGNRSDGDKKTNNPPKAAGTNKAG